MLVVLLNEICTANARVYGSSQRDAFQGFRVRIRWGQAPAGSTIIGGTGTYEGYTSLNESTQTIVTDGVHGTPRVSYETRSMNTAYYPRVHV